jgi:hypothetical protein
MIFSHYAQAFERQYIVFCENIAVAEVAPGKYQFLDGIGSYGGSTRQLVNLNAKVVNGECEVSVKTLDAPKYSTNLGKTGSAKFYFNGTGDTLKGRFDLENVRPDLREFAPKSCTIDKKYEDSLGKCKLPTRDEGSEINEIKINNEKREGGKKVQIDNAPSVDPLKNSQSVSE